MHNIYNIAGEKLRKELFFVWRNLEKNLLVPFVSFRWWRNLGLSKDLSFARDRLTESFMCSVGFAFEPKYTYLRKLLTKVTNLIAIIDDVYGILEELKLFTNVVNRLVLQHIK